MASEHVSLVVESRVRDVIKKENMRTAEDYLGGLSNMVHKLILAATKRAKANGRQTVREQDV